jgi:chemotaxis protein CheX
MESSEPSSTAAVLRLNQVLDLNAAAPLANEFVTLLGRDVEVDASGVERLGAQCLQVLLSARATWGSDGSAFALVAPSSEFTATLALLGASFERPLAALEPSA